MRESFDGNPCLGDLRCRLVIMNLQHYRCVLAIETGAAIKGIGSYQSLAIS